MSAPIRAFDPLTAPISGTNLIEASAGTGKTYGIAALFTRLIVLEQKSVERVLVVTFTKAATAELKTRLRARLDDVLQVWKAKKLPNLETTRFQTALPPTAPNTTKATPSCPHSWNRLCKKKAGRV